MIQTHQNAIRKVQRTGDGLLVLNLGLQNVEGINHPSRVMEINQDIDGDQGQTLWKSIIPPVIKLMMKNKENPRTRMRDTRGQSHHRLSQMDKIDCPLKSTMKANQRKGETQGPDHQKENTLLIETEKRKLELDIMMIEGSLGHGLDPLKENIIQVRNLIETKKRNLSIILESIPDQGLDLPLRNTTQVVSWTGVGKRSQSAMIEGGPDQGQLKLSGKEVAGNLQGIQMNADQGIENGQGLNLWKASMDLKIMI